MTLGECISNFILLSLTLLSIQRSNEIDFVSARFPSPLLFTLFYQKSSSLAFVWRAARDASKYHFRTITHIEYIYPSYFCVESRANVKLLRNDRFTAVLHPNKMMAPTPHFQNLLKCN